MEPKWLAWAKRLQAISQNGLAYTESGYDRERYEEIRSISSAIMEQYTGLSEGPIADLFCGETGYATPKIDVRGAVIKERKILMVKEKIDGCWSLPGGWAEMNRSLRETVVKECREEAGVHVDPQRIIAILDHRKHNHPHSAYGIYKIFVLCEMKGGSFQHNTETEDARFFSKDDLPELSARRISRRQIDMCFDFVENDAREPLFD